MPAAIPLVVGAVASYAGASALTVIALTTAASVIVGAYEADQAKKAAKRAYNASLQDHIFTVRSAVQARQYVFGRARVGGVLVYADSIGTNKTALDSIIALAENQCTLVGYYLGDEYVPAASFPGAKYGQVETLDAVEQFTLTGTTASVGLQHAPIAGASLVATWYRGQRERGTASISVGSGTTVNLSGLPGSSFTVTIAYQYYSTSKMQAIYRDGNPTQTSTSWPGYSTPLWTSAHELRGVAHLRMLGIWDDNIYQQGFPAVGAVLDGGPIEGIGFYDPRTGLTGTYSDNPAILWLYWATLPRLYGGCGIPQSWIDLSSVSAAANLCDEYITVKKLDASGYETVKRYQFNGVLSTENAPYDNWRVILSAMAGKHAFTNGQYRLVAGAFRSATLTIRDGDVIGTKPISLVVSSTDTDPPNVVTARINDAAKNWVEGSPPAVRNTAYITQDGAEESRDVTLAGTSDSRQSNYLMGVMLESLRPAMQLQLSVRGIGEDIALLDTLQLDLVNRASYSARTFEVVGLTDNWDGTFDLTLSEMKASTFTLDADRFNTTAPYVLPDLSYLWNVSALSGFTASVLTPQMLPDGSSIARVQLNWTKPTQAYVLEGGHIECRYLSMSSPITTAGADVSANSTGTVITAALANDYYQFQARVVNGVGAASPWVSAFVSVLGTALPGSVAMIYRGTAQQGDGIYKTTTASAWDADAYSVQGYRNGAYVSFRPTQTNAGLMVGLNGDPGTDTSYTSIDYAMYCNTDGTLYAFESGINAQTLGSYSANDDLSVTYDGFVVRYVRNGVVLREAMAGANRIFYADSSFLTPDGAINTLRFGPYGSAQPILYIARGNCVVSDTTAQKSGGSNGWDSDVYSLRTYPTCHVVFKPNETTSYVMVGLNDDPLTDQSYTSINFAWYCAGGTLAIYENGVNVGNYGTYDTTTQLAITYDGTTIRYLKNGAVMRSVGAAGLSLYLDSSFLSPGGGINSLNFGPTTNLDVTDTSDIRANAATDVVSATNSADTYITSTSTWNEAYAAYINTTGGAVTIEISYSAFVSVTSNNVAATVNAVRIYYVGGLSWTPGMDIFADEGSPALNNAAFANAINSYQKTYTASITVPAGGTVLLYVTTDVNVSVGAGNVRVIRDSYNRITVIKR